MADRAKASEPVRNAGETSPHAVGHPPAQNPASHSQPADAGKTSGGGSSGHDQPDDVAGEARIRNQGDSRDQTRLRDRQPPDPLPEQQS
jgi:hypothetical protein